MLSLTLLLGLISPAAAQNCDISPVNVKPPFQFGKLDLIFPTAKSLHYEKIEKLSPGKVLITLKSREESVTYKKKRYFFTNVYVYGRSIHTILGKIYSLEIQFMAEADDGSIIVLSLLCEKKNDAAKASFLSPLYFGQGLIRAMELNTSLSAKNGYAEIQIPKDPYFIHYRGTLVSNTCTQADYFIFIRVTDISPETAAELYNEESRSPVKNSTVLFTRNEIPQTTPSTTPVPAPTTGTSSTSSSKGTNSTSLPISTSSTSPSIGTNSTANNYSFAQPTPSPAPEPLPPVPTPTPAPPPTSSPPPPADPKPPVVNTPDPAPTPNPSLPASHTQPQPRNPPAPAPTPGEDSHIPDLPTTPPKKPSTEPDEPSAPPADLSDAEKAYLQRLEQLANPPKTAQTPPKSSIPLCKKICVKYALGTIVNRRFEHAESWAMEDDYLKKFEQHYECLKFKCIIPSVPAQKTVDESLEDVCDLRLRVVLNRKSSEVITYDTIEKKCKNALLNDEVEDMIDRHATPADPVTANASESAGLSSSS